MTAGLPSFIIALLCHKASILHSSYYREVSVVLRGLLRYTPPQYQAPSLERRSPVPLPKQHTYTSEDYWNLPDGERAELIDGRLYNMAPPSRIHQKLVSELTQTIGSHIKSKSGSCEVYPAPFAVNLNADDKTYVEPDISVICDKNKLTDRGCSGAPDLVIEVVSPSSSRMDYILK